MKSLCNTIEKHTKHIEILSNKNILLEIKLKEYQRLEEDFKAKL